MSKLNFATPSSAHPEALGERWGDTVSDKRKVVLKALADKQRAWASTPTTDRGPSAFAGIQLSGADVLWLAAYAAVGPDADDFWMATQQKRLVEEDSIPSLGALHL